MFTSVVFPLLGLAGLSLIPIFLKNKKAQSDPDKNKCRYLFYLGRMRRIICSSRCSTNGANVILLGKAKVGTDSLNYRGVPVKAFLAGAKNEDEFGSNAKTDYAKMSEQAHQ